MNWVTSLPGGYDGYRSAPFGPSPTVTSVMADSKRSSKALTKLRKKAS